MMKSQAEGFVAFFNRHFSKKDDSEIMDKHIVQFILNSEKDKVESKISPRGRCNQGGQSHLEKE